MSKTKEYLESLDFNPYDLFLDADMDYDNIPQPAPDDLFLDNEYDYYQSIIDRLNYNDLINV